MVINSPNMGLPIPTVQNEPGPQFAQDVNQALSIIDSHTHSPGNGLPIGSQSLNIQTDLSFNIQNATNIRTTRFVSTTASSGTDVGCVYVRGVDLFYNDLNANAVRITQNGGLSTTAQFIGQIATTAIISATAGTPATSGFIRMNNNSDFVSWRNAGNTGDDRVYFDSSDNFKIIGGPNTGPQAFNFQALDQTNGKIITIAAPQATSAYTLLLPSQPTSASYVPIALSSSGGILTNPPNMSFAGKTVKASGNNLIVSNTNAATNALSIIRAQVTSLGDAVTGEGLTSTYNSGNGGYVITYTTPFLTGDIPIAIVSGVFNGGANYKVIGVVLPGGNNTGCTVVLADPTTGAAYVGSLPTFNTFNIIVIGQRA